MEKLLIIILFCRLLCRALPYLAGVAAAAFILAFMRGAVPSGMAVLMFLVIAAGAAFRIKSQLHDRRRGDDPTGYYLHRSQPNRRPRDYRRR